MTAVDALKSHYGGRSTSECRDLPSDRRLVTVYVYACLPVWPK